MQADVIREEQLNVRLSPAEMRRARQLAEHYGVTPANVVRMLLKDRARDLGLDDSPAAPVPRERKSAPRKPR
jgi:antitoxin component of RelBE/YafQ-DinJ toxin-antitoxin module